MLGEKRLTTISNALKHYRLHLIQEALSAEPEQKEQFINEKNDTQQALNEIEIKLTTCRLG